MKETLNLLEFFRFQCLAHYINEPDNEVSCEFVSVLEFLKLFIYY